MRLLLLYSLLLPQLAWAQFSKEFEAGSYILNINPSVRQYGQLKLRNERKLIIKTIEGRISKAKPKQISSFRIGDQQYIIIRNFRFIHNSVPVNIKTAFVERLDSGQVTIMRYSHLLNTGPDWLFLYRYPIQTYLLRAYPDAAITEVGNYFDKSEFRRRAQPFLVLRADLVRLLAEERITYQNLPAAIHALNNNLPFQPPAATGTDK